MSLSKADLHEYQKYCEDFIITHPVAALFLDLGLGKTVTTLTAVNELILSIIVGTFSSNIHTLMRSYLRNYSIAAS